MALLQGGMSKRSSNSRRKQFFHYTRSEGRRHSRLKLKEILESVYLFLYTRMTIREMSYTSGHSLNTNVDWNHIIREVCTLPYQKFRTIRRRKNNVFIVPLKPRKFIGNIRILTYQYLVLPPLFSLTILTRFGIEAFKLWK